MIMKWRLSFCPSSMTWTMLGWRSRIPASASLWNRSTASGIVSEPVPQHLDRHGLRRCSLCCPR